MSNNSSLVKRLIFKLVKKHLLASTLNSAVRNIGDLNSKGLHTTITFLNDYVTDMSKAKYNANTYMQLFRQMSKYNLDSSVSVRLSQIGFGIDKESAMKSLNQIIGMSEKLGIKLWLEAGYSIDLATLFSVYNACKAKSRRIGIELPIQFSMSKAGNALNANDMLKLSIYKNASHLVFDKNAGIKSGKQKQQKARSPPKPEVQIDNEINAIKALIEKGIKLTLFVHNYGLAVKILKGIKEQKYRKNLIFELPLDTYSKKSLKMLKMNKISVYAPYGKDWIPYAVDRLIDGYIKDIAISILNARYAKYNKIK
ncbi:MAG: hypothetical protein M1331_01335 [Candidatus Marsarchaeota archaeon]|nr:hypothetical protein [Candidatus Marsarchaeota archaeon]